MSFLLILDTAPPLDQNKTLVIRSSDVILLLCENSFWSRGGAVLNFRHEHLKILELKIEENGAIILLSDVAIAWSRAFSDVLT